LKAPKIAIDGQLLLGTPTGIGEYLRELLPALRARSVHFDVLSQANYDPWRFDRRFIWDQCLLPRQAAPYPLLHCTAGTMPVLRRKRAVIVTVHDVAWLRVQRHARWYARAYFGDLMLREYRRARAIMTVSAFSRDELLSLGELDPEKIHIVRPGVSGDFMQLARCSERPRGTAPLILAVGTVEPRKNLALAIRALARMYDRRARLISCGPPTPYLTECKALARRLGVSERIEFRGYLSRQELLELYAVASIAVVPSLYEGFGLPAAQALVAGVPLIVAKTSSLPEIAGNDGYVLDPDDETAWSSKFDEICAHQALENGRAQRARGPAQERFSWAVHAAMVEELYRLAESS
jgi:glycosyltransferase involved in cell wall biosynthesis